MVPANERRRRLRIGCELGRAERPHNRTHRRGLRASLRCRCRRRGSPGRRPRPLGTAAPRSPADGSGAGERPPRDRKRRSGTRGSARRTSMNCRCAGSKRKKPKSCTGSRYRARTVTSSLLRKTACGAGEEHAVSLRGVWRKCQAQRGKQQLMMCATLRRRASAMTGPGRTTWRFVRIRPAARAEKRES